MIPNLQLTAIAAAIAALIGFGGGYKIASWRADAAQTVVARASAKALAEMTSERDALAGKLSAERDANDKKVKEAQDETTRLRDDVASGRIGLRIAAKCPSAAEATSAPGSSVDTGSPAELDATARRAYFALRDGINRADAQLSACQTELRLRTTGAGSK